jgi:hypothetical protein
MVLISAVAKEYYRFPHAENQFSTRSSLINEPWWILRSKSATKSSNKINEENDDEDFMEDGEWKGPLEGSSMVEEFKQAFEEAINIVSNDPEINELMNLLTG